MHRSPAALFCSNLLGLTCQPRKISQEFEALYRGFEMLLRKKYAFGILSGKLVSTRAVRVLKLTPCTGADIMTGCSDECELAIEYHGNIQPRITTWR